MSMEVDVRCQFSSIFNDGLYTRGFMWTWIPIEVSNWSATRRNSIYYEVSELFTLNLETLAIRLGINYKYSIDQLACKTKFVTIVPQQGAYGYRILIKFIIFTIDFDWIFASFVASDIECFWYYVRRKRKRT